MPGQELKIPTADGELKAFLALPDGRSSTRADISTQPERGSASPGVIVLHELFGLNGDIRRITQRFADNGYAALAPDLYSVGPSLKPICIMRTMKTLQQGQGRAIDDIESARAWLAQRDDVDQSRMAVAGFCLGGGFAILHAARSPVGAAAVFYGRVPRDASELEGICPVVASYGERDRTFVGQAERLREHLDELGVEHEITVYPGAGHSFMSSYGGLQGRLVRHSRMSIGYHEESAEAAWRTMLEFFDRSLHGTSEQSRT